VTIILTLSITKTNRILVLTRVFCVLLLTILYVLPATISNGANKGKGAIVPLSVEEIRYLEGHGSSITIDGYCTTNQFIKFKTGSRTGTELRYPEP
jgi:hypothetical protein